MNTEFKPLTNDIKEIMKFNSGWIMKYGFIIIGVILLSLLSAFYFGEYSHNQEIEGNIINSNNKQIIFKSSDLSNDSGILNSIVFLKNNNRILMEIDSFKPNTLFLHNLENCKLPDFKNDSIYTLVVSKESEKIIYKILPHLKTKK